MTFYNSLKRKVNQLKKNSKNESKLMANDLLVEYIRIVTHK